MAKINRIIYIKLAAMMFLQYMLFAVWWVPLAAYLTKLGINDLEKSLILSSMGFGCLAAPFVGMLADRFYHGQRILAFSNLISGSLLLLASTTSNSKLLLLLLLGAMVLYMPTWGLTSAIAMKHLSSDSFARVRVFGSVGWVVSGGFSLFFSGLIGVDFDGSNLPFYCAAGVAFFTFVQNLTLPDTPPPFKGKSINLQDLIGIRMLRLLRDRNFFWFIVLSFLSMVPFSMYWSYCSEFLFDKDFKYISITMNLGQLFEMLLILTVPFIVKKTGLRITMILGLIAMLIRYLSFYSGTNLGLGIFYFAGIIVHGLIFGYFYLGGQMYIDRKVPNELKSESQGFLFLITFGIGLIAGNIINGKIISFFSVHINNEKLYNWDAIWGVTSLSALIILIAFIFLFKKESYEKLGLIEQ